jgi:hypothetical protein
MHQQSNSNPSVGCFEKGHDRIYRHCVVSMQRVKLDAATISFKNRIGKEVIEINEHSSQKDEIYLLPFLPKENERYEQRKQEVKTVMYELFHIL